MAERTASDETYILSICDKLLGQSGLRQAKFDELRGDPSASGASRRLPVDAYYPSIKLVIEFHETQHTKAVGHFDKPHKMTVSGVHRGIQRALYEQRRRDVLPKLGLTLVEIDYAEFRVSSGR